MREVRIGVFFFGREFDAVASWVCRSVERNCRRRRYRRPKRKALRADFLNEKFILFGKFRFQCVAEEIDLEMLMFLLRLCGC